MISPGRIQPHIFLSSQSPAGNGGREGRDSQSQQGVENGRSLQMTPAKDWAEEGTGSMCPPPHTLNKVASARGREPSQESNPRFKSEGRLVSRSSAMVTSFLNSLDTFDTTGSWACSRLVGGLSEGQGPPLLWDASSPCKTALTEPLRPAVTPQEVVGKQGGGGAGR